MRHRHLNHTRFTLAAIDDLIARGQWRHWAGGFGRLRSLRLTLLLRNLDQVAA